MTATASRNNSEKSFGDVLVMIYLVLTPLYYYMPRIPIIEANPLRLIGIFLFLTAIYYAFKYPAAKWSVRMWIHLAAALFIARMAFSMLALPTVAVLGETFSTICMFSMLMILLSPVSGFQSATLFKMISLVSILGTIVAVGTFLHVIPIPGWVRFEGIFLNERTAWCIDPMLGVLGQYACILLLVTSTKTSDRVIGFLGLPLCWLNIFLGLFRSQFALALFLSGGLLVVSALGKSRRTATIGVILAAASLLILTDPMDRMSALWERFQLGRGLSLDEVRISELELEQDLIITEPWVGHGFGLGRYESHYVPGIGEMPAFGHNLYTSTAARAGLPMAFVLLGGWFLLGVSLWRRSRKTASFNTGLFAWSGVFLVLGILIVGPVINLFTMTILTPIYSFFMAPALTNRRLAAP